MQHNWHRNVVTVWLSQFFSIAGFSFAIPFAPFFMQELGVHDEVRLRLWVSAFSAAVPLTMAFFAPIWGAAADRYGRRVMLLRANFAAWLVLTLMGAARNVETLVALRALQGAFTGTMTAAQAMVAADAPPERSGMALGGLSAAVFSGSLAGVALGGVCAEWFGYRTAFFISGLLLLAAALLVLLGTREPERSTPTPPATAEQDEVPRGRLGGVWPILGLILAINFVRQFDAAWVPLLVQEVHGRLQGASLWTGLLSAGSGVAGMLAGLILGHLADRIPPPRIGKVSALFAGLLMIPQGLAQGFGLLFATRFGCMFCAGGLDPVFQIWLSKRTPQHRRGAVFGWASSARCIGWMLAALGSGALAAWLGIRATFLLGALLYLLLIPAITAGVRQLEQAKKD
ncbi:MAG: MFS transporter [Verrucomicrobia bacterium]|nr:MAG: MFS transporter [Verrucomicrobiota bacterium]